MPADVGQQAPELSVVNNERKPVAIGDLKGKTTVLAFFPGAFTGGCQQEACTFKDSMAEYTSVNAQIFGVSVDSSFAQNAFAKANDLNFPFLSDYTRKTIQDYGVPVNDFAGMTGYTTSMRAVFVLDKDGVIQYKTVVAPTEQPDFDEIKQAVQKLG